MVVASLLSQTGSTIKKMITSLSIECCPCVPLSVFHTPSSLCYAFEGLVHIRVSDISVLLSVSLR